MEPRVVPKFILCPSCNEKYNDCEKRRVIDSCGHPRCFTCLCTSSTCLCCSKSKQITDIDSPSGGGINDSIKWKPRSESMHGNIQDRMLNKDRRSKSLCQLSTRIIAKKTNPLTSDADNRSKTSTNTLEDNSTSGMTDTSRPEREVTFKVDRKLSFSSVLNRNSESYKQSRFRRASSFSFMPKDSSTTTNSEISSFESNLRIRHRPRPKSLNLNHAVDSERDSPVVSIQCTDSPEDKKEPGKRRTPLDSIVEMAAAWLEESKSIMESQCCALAPDGFDCVKEEMVENGAKGTPEEVDVGAGLSNKYDGDCKYGSMNICQVSGKKNIQEGVVADCNSFNVAGGIEKSEAKALGTRYCDDHCPLVVATSDNPNELISHAKSDLDAGDISADVAKTGEEDMSYLEDVRELLKGLKVDRTFEPRIETAHVVNIDCSVRGIAAEDLLEKHEDDIATLNGDYGKSPGPVGNPLLDPKSSRDMDVAEFSFKQQFHHKEPYMETGKTYAQIFDAAKEADCTSTIIGGERRSLRKEGFAIDREDNEQQYGDMIMNNHAGFTGPHTSKIKGESLVAMDTSQSGVPKDVMRQKSHSSLQTVLKGQISSNEPRDLKEKSFDILPGAFVRGSARPRSFTPSGNVKVTMTELQYLPSVKKNRRKRAYSFDSSRYERKPLGDLQEGEFQANDPSATSGHICKSVASLPEEAQEQCSSGGGTGLVQSRHSLDEPPPPESMEGEECESLLQASDRNSNQYSMGPLNECEETSLAAEVSNDTTVRRLSESIDPCDDDTVDESAAETCIGSEDCSKVSGKDHSDGLDACLEKNDCVEEIFTNKTDDWKAVNYHMINGKSSNSGTRCNGALDDSPSQDREVPVVFINGNDFCTSWFREEKRGKICMHPKNSKDDTERSLGAESIRLGHTPMNGIGFLREKFQKLARWSKRGAEIETEKGRLKFLSGRKNHRKQKRKKNSTIDSITTTNGAKNISFYDVNRNIILSPEIVQAMRENRKVRRRKFDKEEGCCLNKKQLSKNEKQFQGNGKLGNMKESSRLRQNNDEKPQLLAHNQPDEASLTTVSTLADNFNHCADSDTGSSVFSARCSNEDEDSSDSTVNGPLLHSDFSTSSDTLNESIEEGEMPNFRSPSRIQDHLAALLERKVTRKRQGLEEIDFHPLIPATKGRALVPRDWLYERFHRLLDSDAQDRKRVLLVSGGRGCGKTTLLKSLIWSDCISHGKKRMRERISTSILSFHFCSRANANTISSAKFILNMAARLVENNQFAAYTRSLSDSKAVRHALSRDAAEKSPETALRDGILKPLNEIYGSGYTPGDRWKRYLLLLDSLDHECKNCRTDECITSLLASNVHLLPFWITLVVTGTREALQVFNGQEVDEINLENVADWDVQSDLYCFTEIELPILSSQLSESKIQKLVDNIVRFSRGSFHVAHMSVQYLSSSFASFIHQPNLHSLDVDRLVGHLFKMKFCITERCKILAISLLEVLLVSQESLTFSNLFKTVESSCTSNSVSFQEYESCVRKLLQLEMIAESTEGRYIVNNITRHWMQSHDGVKTGFNASKGHNLLSVYYMKTLTNNDGKNIYRLAHHLSQSSFGEDIVENEKRIAFLAWTLNQVFKNATAGFMEPCNVYKPIDDVYHIFLHTELDLNAFQRKYGAHPIVVASAWKQARIVSLILQHGVPKADHLHQALEEAIRGGSTEILDMLLAHVSGLSLLKPRDPQIQKSCLDAALGSDQLLTAVKLLAIIFKDESEDDRTRAMAAQKVLCKACLQGRADIVEELFNAGYIHDPDELDSDGNAPLVLAASANKLTVAKCLIGKHSNVNVTNGNKVTPLLASVMNGYVETSEWLISQDANVNAEDKDGRTPLIYAAAKDLPQLIQSLFMEGATLSHQDHNGLTALSHACKNGSKEAVKTLLKNRATTDTEDNLKRTPLYYACLNRNLRSIQLLLEYGANVNKKIGKKQKPLELALKEGYLDVAALLLRYGAHVGKSAIEISESSIGAFLCLVGHMEQRGNIMIKAGKYATANENFQRALNIIENSKHRNNKRVIRIKLLCQQDSKEKFI